MKYMWNQLPMDLNSENLLFPAIITFWQVSCYLSHTADCSLHYHSPQLTHEKLLSPCTPVNLQITPVLPTELPCISSRGKKKEKEDNLSWLNRCFVFDSARCHSTLSCPLSFFFPRAGLHLQNWDPNPYVFTCLLPSGPPASCSTVLAPFFLGYFEISSSNAVSSYKAPQVYYLFLCIKIRLIYRPSIAGKLSFFLSSQKFLSSLFLYPAEYKNMRHTDLPEYVSEGIAAARVVNTASVSILTK